MKYLPGFFDRNGILTDEDFFRWPDARDRAEADFYWWCRWIEGYAGMYEPFHRPMCEYLTDWGDNHMKLQLEPRKHLKSSIKLARHRHIWLTNPDYRILFWHAKKSMAVPYLREGRARLESNPKYHLIAPDVFWKNPVKESPLWSVDRYTIRRPTIDKVPSLLATGEDAGTTGFHYNEIDFDDPVFQDNVGTEDLRKKTFELMQLCIDTQLHAGGRVVLTGTRWHLWDVFGIWLEPDSDYYGDYDIRISTCWDETGEPVFPPQNRGRIQAIEGMDFRPTGFTREELLDKQRRMRRQFNCQYLNHPLPEDSAFFLRADFRWFDELPGEEGDYLFYTAVDPNRSVKTRNDSAAVVTCAVDYRGDMWVVEIYRGHPTPLQLAEVTMKHIKRWRPRCVGWEDVAAQGWGIDDLRRMMVAEEIRCPIKPMKRWSGNRKDDRIGDMQSFVENNQLHIKRGYDIVATELEQFPQARSDDVADCLADIFVLRKRGLPRDPESRKPTILPPQSPFILSNLLSGTREGRGDPVRKIYE